MNMVFAVVISAIIFMAGHALADEKLSSLEEINVMAPFEGKIKEKYFVDDQKEEKGN